MTASGSDGQDAGVVAVVITFNPDLATFAEQARRLGAQVGASILVDNGSDPATLTWLRHLAGQHGDRITLIEFGQNLGIAAAQNKGIAMALSRGASRILLMDHDSLPEQDMVRQLGLALDRLQRQGLRVAAVGPRYTDTRQNNPPPFIRVRGGRLHRLPCPAPDTVNEVDYLIASGSLIPAEALLAVGTMRENLFIDYVDIEWGLRAREAGYLSFGVCAARMKHDLGENPIVFLGRALPSHSALRHYYHFRNAVWLYRFSDLPLQWKMVDAYRLLLRLVFYSLFARPRGAQILSMLGGMLDGLRGRLGPRRFRASAPAATTASTRAPR